MPNGKRPPQKNWPQEEKPKTSEESLKKIIENGDVEELNKQANGWGKYFTQGGERDRLSSSQIRNVLDRLQRMKTFDLESCSYFALYWPTLPADIEARLWTCSRYLTRPSVWLKTTPNL